MDEKLLRFFYGRTIHVLLRNVKDLTVCKKVHSHNQADSKSLSLSLSIYIYTCTRRQQGAKAPCWLRRCTLIKNCSNQHLTPLWDLGSNLEGAFGQGPWEGTLGGGRNLWEASGELLGRSSRSPWGRLGDPRAEIGAQKVPSGGGLGDAVDGLGTLRMAWAPAREAWRPSVEAWRPILS